jgi:hypothetical protein
MCETWVSIVCRDSNSLAAISGFDSPASSSSAILVSVGVRPSYLRVRRLRPQQRPAGLVVAFRRG